MIENRLDEIQSHFVKYFGKSYRDAIEEAFKDIVLNVYSKSMGDFYEKLPTDDFLMPVSVEKYSPPNFCLPNAKIKDGKIKQQHIVAFDLDTYIARPYYDYVINHELCHAVMSHVRPANHRATTLESISGLYKFQFVRGINMYKFMPPHGSLSTKRLNELLNDTYATEITRSMHSKSAFIVDESDHGAEYASACRKNGNDIRRAKPFMQKYRNVLVEAGLKKQHGLIETEIGAENILTATRNL